MNNRDFINECFDIYMFNLVNSEVEIKFLPIDEIFCGKNKDDMHKNIDWDSQRHHDDYLREKLDISDEGDRIMDIGLDVFDNGTYWGIPIRMHRNKYYINGGTHRANGLKKVRKLNLRNFDNRRFLCYSTNKFEENTEIIHSVYDDVISKNILDELFNDDYMDKLNSMKKDIHTNYYIVYKKLVDIMYEHVDRNCFTMVGTYLDDFYIIKSFSGLVVPLDILTATVKNVIHKERAHENVAPHPCIYSEDVFLKNKHLYNYKCFFERNKDKVNFT